MKLFNIQTQQFASIRSDNKSITICLYATFTNDDLQLSQTYTYCVADVLVRYLQMQGQRVKLNLVLAGDTLPENPWLDAWMASIQTLNVRPPDHLSLITDTQPPVMQTDILITANPPNRCDGEQPILADLCLETAVPQQAKISISSPLQHHSANTLRIYLAQYHYRQPWTYDEVNLQKAASFVEKLQAAMSALSTGQQTINITPVQRRFMAVMDNDLDTGKGIATLLNLADEILFRAANGYQIDEAQTALQRMAAVLGLHLTEETTAENNADGWHAFRQQFAENPV